MIDRPRNRASGPYRGGSAEPHGPYRSPGLVGVEVPAPEPFWLMLLATLCGMVLPAAAAIAAMKLLGPPDVPHASRLALVAAAGLTVAEAIFAGLGSRALVEAASRGVRLPGSGPVEYLPLRWVRRRATRRDLIALSRGVDVQRRPHPRRGRHIFALFAA